MPRIEPTSPGRRAELRRAVRYGPFAGLAYVTDSAGSALTPKLLGTYERELHRVIESIVARQPRHIVNIGCAEGYYAVGLAWRLPNAAIDVRRATPRDCGVASAGWGVVGISRWGWAEASNGCPDGIVMLRVRPSGRSVMAVGQP